MWEFGTKHATPQLISAKITPHGKLHVYMYNSCYCQFIGTVHVHVHVEPINSGSFVGVQCEKSNHDSTCSLSLLVHVCPVILYMYCMCDADDRHTVQGKAGVTYIVYSTVLYLCQSLLC